MDCRTIRKDLHAYLDGEIAAGERAAIEGHLASCPACREALGELKQTLNLLDNLDEVEPPAWLTQKVMARVRAESTEREGFFRRFLGWIPLHLPATAVATLVIAVTAAVLIKSMEPQLHDTLQKATGTDQSPVPAPAGLPPQIAPDGRLASPTLPAETVPPGKAQGPDIRKPSRTEDAAPDPQSAGIQEHRAPSRRQAPAPLPAAPAAPAVSSSPGPAALPERDTARGRALRKDSSPVEESRPPANVGEGKAAGSQLLNQQRRVVTERYPGGTPRVVITYQNTSGKSGKMMEERFDERGLRHGLHRSYDDSGNLTAEVHYRHGEPVAVREFNADGTPKPRGSARDWPWLQPHLQ